MPSVVLTCPKCGGNMEPDGDKCVCPYCKTITMNIFSPKIAFDPQTSGLEEFAKTLRENKQLFIIKSDGVFLKTDPETLIVNKKIEMAEKLLQEEEYDEVIKTLKGVQNFPAARLCMLATNKVRDEFPLTMRASVPDFSRIYSTCDDQDTINTYREIEKICRINIEVKRLAEKGYEMLSLNMYDETLAYARNLCAQYPNKAAAWDLAACAVNLKARRSPFLPPIGEEVSYMIQCPDYAGDERNLFTKYCFLKSKAIHEKEIECTRKLNEFNVLGSERNKAALAQAKKMQSKLIVIAVLTVLFSALPLALYFVSPLAATLTLSTVPLMALCLILAILKMPKMILDDNKDLFYDNYKKVRKTSKRLAIFVTLISLPLLIAGVVLIVMG